MQCLKRLIFLLVVHVEQVENIILQMPATCQRSPDHARGISLLGITTLVENSVDSSSMAAASETRINSRPGKSAKNSVSLLMILVTQMKRKSFNTLIDL